MCTVEHTHTDRKTHPPGALLVIMRAVKQADIIALGCSFPLSLSFKLYYSYMCVSVYVQEQTVQVFRLFV